MKKTVIPPGWIMGLILIIMALAPARVAAAEEALNVVGETTIGNVTYKAIKEGSYVFVYPFPKDQDIENAVILDIVDITIDNVKRTKTVFGLEYDWGECPNLKWIAFDSDIQPAHAIYSIFDYQTKPQLKNIFLFSDNNCELHLSEKPSSLTVYSSTGRSVSNGFKGEKSFFLDHKRINPCGVSVQFNPDFLEAIGCEPTVEATRDADTFTPLEIEDGTYTIYGKENKIRYTFPILSHKYDINNLYFGDSDISANQTINCIGGYKFTLDPVDPEFSEFTVYNDKDLLKQCDDGYYISPNYNECRWSATRKGFECSGTIRCQVQMPIINVSLIDTSIFSALVQATWDKSVELLPGAEVLLNVSSDDYPLNQNNTAVVPLGDGYSYTLYSCIKTVSGDRVFASGDIKLPKRTNFKYIARVVGESHYTSIKLGLYNDFEGSVKKDTYFGELKNISVSKYNKGDWHNISGDNTVTFSELRPNDSYYFDFKLEYEKQTVDMIYAAELSTRTFDAQFRVIHLGPTSYTFEINLPEDADGGHFGGSWTDYNQNDIILSKSGLDPQRNIEESFWVKYFVNDSEYSKRGYATRTTPTLTWEEGTSDALTKTKARIMNETNCDATENTGIEWRRVDAPDVVKSSVADCPVVDGMLVGVLDNLNPDVYYQYRPFYTSDSGNTYYGPWTGIFTGDAGVVFKPEVRTGQSRPLSDNSVSLLGSVVPGSDDVSEQGFEWWQTDAPARISGAGHTRGTIKADGIRMEAELTDLRFGTSYTYRAYAKVGAETYYGAEQTFTTRESSGITDAISNLSNQITVSLRENPIRSTAWVKVSGCSSTTARLAVTSVSGATVAQTDIIADGEWQSVNLDIPNGLYLLTAISTDGSHDTVRLIIAR